MYHLIFRICINWYVIHIPGMQSLYQTQSCSLVSSVASTFECSNKSLVLPPYFEIVLGGSWCCGIRRSGDVDWNSENVLCDFRIFRNLISFISVFVFGYFFSWTSNHAVSSGISWYGDIYKQWKAATKICSLWLWNNYIWIWLARYMARYNKQMENKVVKYNRQLISLWSPPSLHFSIRCFSYQSPQKQVRVFTEITCGACFSSWFHISKGKHSCPSAELEPILIL
jgi:hypothetical protein